METQILQDLYPGPKAPAQLSAINSLLQQNPPNTPTTGSVNYNSEQVLNKSSDYYGGLEYLTLIMFSVVQHYDALLKNISKDLNSSRQGYNAMFRNTELIVKGLRKLRKITNTPGIGEQYRNPKLCILIKKSDIPAPTKDSYKYTSEITAVGGDVNDYEPVLSDEEMEGVAQTMNKLDPTALADKDKLEDEDTTITLDKLKEISADAQQRLVYMNSVSVQQGGLIQAAETNYQIVVQFSAGIISVIKSVGGAIAQRL